MTSFDEAVKIKFNDANIDDMDISMLSILKKLEALSIESKNVSQSNIIENLKEMRPDIAATFILARSYLRAE